ncbi:hypothetical protein S1OALGB6SA_1643 [Olavius algarvensis spirochete endosymbiont]|nr:hypothetical protein S1OALGB6SA_1643 [Olavius algarvensis spirochete endosymbiont]
MPQDISVACKRDVVAFFTLAHAITGNLKCAFELTAQFLLCSYQAISGAGILPGEIPIDCGRRT